MNLQNTSSTLSNGKKFSIEQIERRKNYTFHADVLDFISKKANIKPKFVVYLLDLFVYAIKKTLIEQGEVIIYGFGIISTKGCNRKKKVKFYKHSFKTASSLKTVLKGETKPLFVEKYSPFLQKNFEIICTTLNLEMKDVKYLFSLFFYCIILNLLKYKVYRLRRFGYFYVKERPWLSKTWVSRKWSKFSDRPVNTKFIEFKQAKTSWEELNSKTISINVSRKIKRMFHLMNFDRITRSIAPMKITIRKCKI